MDADAGGAPDPRDEGKEDHRREAGQYKDRGGVRQMRRAQPRAGGEGRDAREIRMQELRAKAGDALTPRALTLLHKRRKGLRIIRMPARQRRAAFDDVSCPPQNPPLIELPPPVVCRAQAVE